MYIKIKEIILKNKTYPEKINYYVCKDHKYKYPGFLQSNKHPENLCLVCCHTSSSLNPNKPTKHSTYNSCKGKDDTDNESSINIKYILITEDLSFLPDNILNYCLHIKYSRPSRSSYNKCFKIKLTNENDISLITNIKDIKSENIFKDIKKNINKEDNNIIEFQKILCDKIIKNILNINELKFLNLRDLLYDICIYDINIANCIIYILKTLIIKNKLDNEKLTKIITDTYGFLKLYNNNYRPIYHLEKYILYITSVVHEL